MRRLAIVAVVLCAAMMTSAQQGSVRIGRKNWSLGESEFVAESPDVVTWSPDGRDLVYSAQRDGQIEVGLYSLKTNQNAVVAKLLAGEKIQALTWLNAGHQVVFITRQPVEGRSEPTELLSVRVADSNRMDCRELLSRAYPKAEGSSVEIMESPSLAHAIITIYSQKGPAYYALTQNSGRLVLSNDINEAVRAGKAFSGWSSHGTALFGTALKNTYNILSSKFMLTNNSQATSTTNTADPTELFLNLSISQDALFVRAATAPINVGETVLECIPANGALRQVRYTGPFIDPPSVPSPFRVYARNDVHQLGGSSATVQSLWLVVAEEKEPKQGLLVTAQGGESYMAPNDTAIAFTSHNSLFVRRLTAGN